MGNKVWGADHKGQPRIFAVGDCNYSCVEEPGKKPNEWPIPPMPKISYPGEEEAVIACGNLEKNSGFMVTWGSIAAVQKEIIEATITDEAQYGLIGHFVHHTPVHLFGGGPVWGYTW